MGMTYTQVLLCIGMLVTGSLNTLSKKAQNDCSAPGYYEPHSNNTSPPHKFDHPWFQTLIMFIGEMTCLLGLAYSRYKERKSMLEKEQNRLMVSPSSSGVLGSKVMGVTHPRIFQWIFAVPTVFDLIGTSLAGIGLLYIEASIWQMLRGSIIIFTGVFSKIFLKRKLKGLQWLGMFVTVVGLILVGLSGVLRETHHTDNKTVLGLIFILAGQAVSAAQMIVEEIFLKTRNYEPLQVVGMEGTFGVVFMAFIVLPAMYFIPGSQIGNRYENSLDALYQIKNDSKLMIFSILYLLSIAFYNYFGLAVTKSLTELPARCRLSTILPDPTSMSGSLSFLFLCHLLLILYFSINNLHAVHRTLMDACRTILVWIVSLFIYYIVSQEYGEPFDKRYGIFQIDGFLFLMVGTALYNEIMDVPCIPSLRKSPNETYPSLIDSSAVPDNASIQTEVASDSERTPLLKRSDRSQLA